MLMKQMQIVVKNTNTRENLQNLHYMLDFSDTSGHLRTVQSIICGQLMNYSKIQSTCVRKAKTHTFKKNTHGHVGRDLNTKKQQINRVES